MKPILPQTSQAFKTESFYAHMGCRRQDVDLEIVLKDPKCAREWIRTYNWECQTPEYIVFGADQKIYFQKMTDTEAVFAAALILRDIEIKRVMRRKGMAEALGEVH